MPVAAWKTPASMTSPELTEKPLKLCKWFGVAGTTSHHAVFSCVPVEHLLPIPVCNSVPLVPRRTLALGAETNETLVRESLRCYVDDRGQWRATWGGTMGSAKAQGVLWGTGAREWSELIEPCQVPFYEAAFDAMGLGRGMTLLDAGCGSGLALELAARRGATPTGLDASEGLLGVARERVADATLHQGDLEDLPFADDTFDAVSAFNSVQFAADPVRAVSEMARVARPGAPVTVTTWASPEQCEMGAVLGALAALTPPPPGMGGPFTLSTPGAVESVVESAGLSNYHVVEVATPFTFADVYTGVRALLATGPGQRAAEHAGDDAARAAVVAAFTRFAQPDGSVLTNNVFRVLVART